MQRCDGGRDGKSESRGNPSGVRLRLCSPAPSSREGSIQPRARPPYSRPFPWHKSPFGREMGSNIRPSTTGRKQVICETSAPRHPHKHRGLVTSTGRNSIVHGHLSIALADGRVILLLHARASNDARPSTTTSPISHHRHPLPLSHFQQTALPPPRPWKPPLPVLRRIPS